MVQKTIKETELFHLLEQKERKNPSAYVYEGQLISAEQTVAPALEYIKNEYPNFTEHGIAHSIGIICAVYDILPEDLKESLSPAELYCFMMAALFHDMGMTTDEEPDIDKRRLNHHLYAGRPIRKYMTEKAAGMREVKRLTDCIVFASVSHGKEIREFYHEKEFGDIDDVDGDPIRYGLIAILLRIGDLLDLEEGRTNEFNMDLNPQYYDDPVSQEHHRRHGEVKRFHKTGSVIEIRIETQNRQRYNIWRGWLDYLDQEIMYANSHYLTKLDEEKDGKLIRYRLPEVKEELKAAEGANFRVEEVKFQLDEKGTLLDIITRSIYTAEFDYIRELVQNAIDAVLLKEYENTRRRLNAVSPRSWNVKTPVLAAYSSRNNHLLVAECGIGMNEAEIRNYLFRAADSGYCCKKKTREFQFPAIAKFGIGFVACLTKMRDMQVTTQMKEEDRIRITLEANSMTAFYEEEAGGDSTGTVISLTPRNSFKFQDLWEYLQKTFCCPSADIMVIDMDRLEMAEDRLGLAVQDKRGCVWPADKLAGRVGRVENERERVLKPYREEYNQLTFMYNKVQRSRFGNKEKKAVATCNIKLEILYDLMGGEEAGDYAREQKKICGNLNAALERGDIHQARLLSVALRNRCLDRIKWYSRPWNWIENKPMADIAPFESAYLNLSPEFLVENIQMDETCFSPGHQGIVLIRCKIEDYSRGIEWQSVHEFLCCKGEVVKYIAVPCSGTGYEPPEEAVLGLDHIEDALEEYSYMSEELDEEFFYSEEGLEVTDFVFNVAGISDNELMMYAGIPEYALEGVADYDGVRLMDSEIWAYHADQADAFRFGESLACQDGIRIDVRPEALAPFGCCRARMNLTAGSRLELNVSRHEISQSVEQVEDWMKGCGSLIQEKVFEQVTGRLRQMGMRWGENLLENGTKPRTTFEKVCKDKALSLLKKEAMGSQILQES